MPDSGERTSHWIKPNHQNRIPGRWIAFDTESRTHKRGKKREQEWRLGAAWRWRTGLKAGDYAERAHFLTPESLWEWVTEFCRKEERTVIWCHNLGYDARISQVFDILPKLGWRLEWCNLGTSVSSMTWRSDRGTLVFADLFTWLPMPLEEVGKLVGVPKMAMPSPQMSDAKWGVYCLRDAEVVYRAVSQLIQFVKDQNLGNWQPTGAGMAYATWRHKFMTHRVLVHDDKDALSAERKGMHTGRAEAWRHGELTGDEWFEVDFRQAYTRIAAGYELPTKLKFHNGPISLHQYTELRSRFRVLARAEVCTAVPCVPTHYRERTLWPSGKFESWLWDAELDIAFAQADRVTIRECYIYTRAPILAEWAKWVLAIQSAPDDVASPVVRKWVKHTGRALIGRISLRTSQWAVWGGNPEQQSGISHMLDFESGRVSRMMHAGDQTFVEEAKKEGRDSLPQVTGYIMSVCRVWLWEAMQAAGFSNIAHVDTDALIVNRAGLAALQSHYGAGFDERWQIKAVYQRMTVHAPRNYYGDGTRKVAGVSKRATETAPGTFTGERWASMAGDMASGITGAVSMYDHKWHVTTEDPRRHTAPGVGTGTIPVQVGHISNVSSLVSSTAADGS